MCIFIVFIEQCLSKILEGLMCYALCQVLNFSKKKTKVVPEPPTVCHAC